MKEGSFLHHGTTLRWWGALQGQKGSLRALKESAAASGQQLEQRENCMDDQGLCRAFPSLRHASIGVGGSWVLELGLQRSEPGRGLG